MAPVALPESKELWDGLLTSVQKGCQLPALNILALLGHSSDPLLVIAAMNQAPKNSLISLRARYLVESLYKGQFSFCHLVWLGRGLTREYKPPPEIIDFAESITRSNQRSAILQFSDFLPLAAAHNGADLALMTAAILGIHLSCSDIVYGYWAKDAHRRNLNIWHRILMTFPYLQTGHLQQLFRQHTDLHEAIELLPGAGNLEPPDISLAGISVFAERDFNNSRLFKK